MLHPSYNELINAVNSDVEPGEQPVVQSRYSIVIAAAKRARQLIDGEEALVPDYGKKALSVAIEELHKGRVKVVAEELPEERVEKYSERAKERIREAYSWQYIADRYEELFSR